MCHFVGDFLLGDYENFHINLVKHEHFPQQKKKTKLFHEFKHLKNKTQNTYKIFGLKNGLKVTQSVNDIKKLNEKHKII